MSISAPDRPFPPLPREFPGEQIGLRFYFYYNLEVSSIGIAPCADVRVPVGSTMQFSALVKGMRDRSVEWSVSGSGCSQSACGTISDNGLYTAPMDIPIPAVIVVQAKSRSDASLSGKAKLTVVQSNLSH